MSDSENGAAAADADTAGAEDGPRAVTPREAQRAIEAGEVELIDVRTPHEWEAGHLPGARHLPLNDLAGAAADLEADRRLLIYCRAGGRSAFAAEGLGQGGYEALSVEGGALA